MDNAQSFDSSSWTWKYSGFQYPDEMWMYSCLGPNPNCTGYGQTLAVGEQIDNVTIINFWWANYD
jgi:hypothetical protein